MEKFSFLKFVKISFFAFGLSSLIFTSCNSDEEIKDKPEIPKNEFPVDVLNLDGINVNYPKNHTFGVWNEGSKIIPVNGTDYKFDLTMTMDKSSKNVRIHYYLLSEPSTAKSSDVDAIADRFKNDVYSEDTGHELLSDETVPFAGYDSRKLTVNQVAYLDKTTYELVPLDTVIYKERYVFFDSDVKKVYTVSIEIPEPLKDSRRTELYDIISSIKVNK